jgi:hypothetical protein
VSPSGTTHFKHTVTRIRRRVYYDFFMPSRLDDLHDLIIRAGQLGYEFLTLEQFYAVHERSRVNPDARYVLLRHDVDTDPLGARLMHEIEYGLGVVGTYYFRLKTVDPSLMRVLFSRGNEVGYHYEELATLVKRRGHGPSTAWATLIPDAREAFVANIARLRTDTGLPIVTAASHGDFVNRKLGVTNTVVLDDPEFRRRAEIMLEAYDQVFTTQVSSRHSDDSGPTFWVGGSSPLDAFHRGEPVVYVLIHPGHWRASLGASIRNDGSRVLDGACFYLRLANPWAGQARHVDTR